MIRSMTGFARREQAGDFGTLAWELRTVNHRYLEVSLRLPEELRAQESEFRQLIAGEIRRGKLDATLTFRPAPGTAVGLELDTALLEELVVRVQEVTAKARARIGELARVTPVELLRWPGVLKEPARNPTSLYEAARVLLGEATSQLAATRASEGARIGEMIRSRLAQIGALTNLVTARLPQVRERSRARLDERLAALNTELSKDRIEQELALLLTRLDVDEELDRLRSHLIETEKALVSEEPSGRRLDFLMQEFNREANTLSSKSQDVEVTRAALDIKVLIEQMREQVQNVE